MTLSATNHAIAIQQSAAAKETRLLALLREWMALDELAMYQASTAKKTADARDSKHAELLHAARSGRGEVLR